MTTLQRNDKPEEEYETDDNELSSDDEHLNCEMILSRLGSTSNVGALDLGKRTVDLNNNWTDSYKNCEEFGTIADFEFFLDKMKKSSNEVNQANYDSGDSVCFSEDQKEIIDAVKKQLESPNNELKRIIVQAKAGTGKSFLIHHITQLLKKHLGSDSYLLAAPTGVSAVLIKGKTLHSVFKIPKHPKDFKALTGQKAKSLVNTFSNVKFLILDEYSMIGCTSLHMISERCKEATGNTDEDFGGLNVILFGDIRQLPPVKDSPLYAAGQKQVTAKHGKLLISNFHKMIHLTTCHRQQDAQFLNVLDNLSKGKTTASDYDMLSSRFTSNVGLKEKKNFEEALRLFATKDLVKEFNMEKLSNLRDANGEMTPVLKIQAIHNNSTAKKGSSDNFEGLEKELYLAKGCKIMLRQNLWVEKGLTNGAMGTVHDFLYHPSKLDFPAVILCEFPNYDGPQIIPGTKIVPIKASLKEWCDGQERGCTRLQFPICVSYACSIHKSQGMTLDKVVVDIGNIEFSLGLAYVGLSRVKTLQGMLIEPFLGQRLTKLKENPCTKLRDDFVNSFGN